MNLSAPQLCIDASSRELAEFQTETTLMAQFRDSRNELEFKRLYDVAHAPLLQWIRSTIRSRAFFLDPLEILQDTFVNIFRYAGSFKDEKARSFRGWSRTIALNQIRHAKREHWRPSLQDLPDGLQEPADVRCKPDDSAELCEQRNVLCNSWSLYLLLYNAAWRELSERDQKALQMVEVEGRSYADACEILDVGMSNMKMIMFRARKRIRDRIRSAFEELELAKGAQLN